MALLGSCWFITESILLQEGSLKWFLFSFYIQPFFLFFCRIFVFVQWLQIWLLHILVILFRITCFTPSFLFKRLFTCFPSSFVRFNRSNTSSTDELLKDEVVEHAASKFKNCNEIFTIGYVQSNIRVYDHHKRILEMNSDYNVDSVLILDYVLQQEPREEDTVNSSACSLTSDIDSRMDAVSISEIDVDSDKHLPSASTSDSPVTEQLIVSRQQVAEEEVDLFDMTYTEKMRWFDVLGHDRICGINAILNQQTTLGHGSSLDQSILSVHMSEIEYLDTYTDDNAARKRLLRSLEGDLEMVYVAQTCLSWEAIRHQHRKVKALTAVSPNSVFYENIADEFQKFQILLERFMENERCSKAKRYWTYVQRRSSIKSLLQVPLVSGYLKVEDEKDGMRREVMKTTVLLKAIEKSMNVFCLFVKTEEDPHKLPWWKFRTLKWSFPPLEDPRDFNLLLDITNSIQKKKLWITELEGKKWYKLKGLKGSGEENKEMVFMTTDIKLVTRVLKMSLVSTSQLKWCKQKLDSIDSIIQRKSVKSSVSLVDCSFPSS